MIWFTCFLELTNSKTSSFFFFSLFSSPQAGLLAVKAGDLVQVVGYGSGSVYCREVVDQLERGGWGVDGTGGEE